MSSSAKEISDLAHGIDVHSSGNVGIGTPNPDAPLTLINSVADAYTPSSFNNKPSITIKSQDGTNNYTGIRFTNTTGGYEFMFGSVQTATSNDYADMVLQGYDWGATTYKEYLRVKSNGNVGIGTDSPADKMHIYNSSGTTVYRADVNANSTVGFEINKTGSTTQSWKIADGITHNGALQFYDGTNSAVRMHIDGSGRIGIGATGPVTGHKMTIKETATENASIVFTDTDDMVGAYVGMAKGNNEITTGATNIDLVLGTAYTADTHLIANNAIGLTLKNGGNVGIGTTNPLGKLHVGFSGRAGVFIGSTNGGGSYLLLDGAGNGDGAGSDYAYIEHQSSGNLAFNVGNSSNSVSEKMTIKPGGYVGINTTNPQRALHIHDHSATGLHITNTQSGSGANDGFSQYIRDDNQATELMVRENSYLGFGTNNTLRAKILSSGEMFWPEISNRGDLTFPICSISNSNSGGQYLHAQFQSYGGTMLHIHFRGYEYIGSSMREGSGGGYVYNTSGQNAIYAEAKSGHCVSVYQTTTNRVELVINTGSGSTSNRWGSYVFFGGTDTITGDTPLTLVQYGWNSSTGRLYSS